MHKHVKHVNRPIIFVILGFIAHFRMLLLLGKWQSHLKTILNELMYRILNNGVVTLIVQEHMIGSSQISLLVLIALKEMPWYQQNSKDVFLYVKYTILGRNTNQRSFIKIEYIFMSSAATTPKRRNSQLINSKWNLTKLKSTLLHRLFNRGQEYNIRGYQSQSFNRRRYQLPIQSLRCINKDTLGFTNNILMLKDDKKKSVQLFVPAYVSLKIKSIQKIQIKDLIAEVNCVLIVILLIDGLSEDLKQHLESNIMVQVNRGDSFQLAVREDSAKVKLKKQGNFLKFIVRDVFPVQIYDDVFLSPFEILNLVLTVTMNSIFMPSELSPFKGYKCQISFNCMRNPQKISISYVSECRLGVYDLAQKKLVHYPSNLATYDQIRNELITYVEGKKPKNHQQMRQSKSKQQKTYNIQPLNRQGSQRLQLKSSKVQKKHAQKLAYYEYSHFVIPVYKFPGNAWATIFIPIIMLAILSMSLFFYKASPAEKIGTIATIVLGFIALIPSIKDQLPPSQRITLSEIIVYIQAINCMLSLCENIFKITYEKRLMKNELFLISLSLHLICLGIAFGLLVIHKFWWEPSYNSTEKAIELSPVDDKDAWNNPYCDEYFLDYNSKNLVKLVKYEGDKQEEKPLKAS